MKLIFCIIFSLLSLPVLAQPYGSPDGQPYPQDYFRNPLDIPIFLAGNFGECRPGHFHSGVDIKTLGKENQPVHAAADGYISRIKMEPGGFGHGLYITHPNGYTTLYAHLNKFVPAIQQYVRREQYKRKRWDVDINLAPDVFPVKQGDQIAWSGNTGASTAPHLHFEIRNTKTEHPLNPELFGLPIVDTMPPVPTEVVLFSYEALGFYDAGRYSVKVGNDKGNYRLEHSNSNLWDGDTIAFYQGPLGVGINVNDYMEGSDNTIAFYKAQLFMDDSLQTEITLDNIGYDQSRYINAYADYKIRQQDNKWVQCFFKLPGNHLDQIYTHLNGTDGWLSTEDGRVHKMKVVIIDDKGNRSTVVFYIAGRVVQDLASSHWHALIFKANSPNSFDDSDISLALDSKALYNWLEFNHAKEKNPRGYSALHKVGDVYIPVHTYFELKLKSDKIIPSELKNKIVMLYTDGHDTDGRAAVAGDEGWYHAKVRAFGTYWLDADTVPPVIKSMQKNGSNLSKAARITFEVKDAMTSVSSFSGSLDGKWICFESHGDQYFYEFDEHCPRGKHKLLFKAEDENGNAAVYELTFTR